MKKLLSFLCISFSVFVFSQNIQADIEDQFRDYNYLIESKNFSKALDVYGNEDFLKLFPKEQMVEMMKQIFDSKEFEFKIYKPENVIVGSEIIKEKEESYVKLSYKQSIDLKFNLDGVKPEVVLTGLQSEFGEEQVTYNKSTGYFEIRSKKDAVANSSDLKNWKFTVIEKKQIPILMQFIPESILRSLN